MSGTEPRSESQPATTEPVPGSPAQGSAAQDDPALHCPALHDPALHYPALHYPALHYPALHYDVSGDGVPVVFTHGWLNTGEVWAGVVAELGGSVRSVSWDMRGHGRSEAAAPGLYSRDHALSDLSRMLDVAGRPAILVGHSLGGYLSLAQAILRPHDVAGLVLVAAGPGFRSPDSREQWNESVRMMAEKAGDIPEGMEEISMHVDSMVMDRLSEIRAPAYTVVGERDKRFQASADVFDKHLDVKRRVQVADAGHMVHAKQPSPVAEAVRFMADLVSAG